MTHSADEVEIQEFPGHRSGETVEFLLFKHWYFLAFHILKALGIIALSFIIPIGLNFMDIIFSYGALAAIYYLWHVFWVGYIIYQYLNWYRDRLIITDQRIININQKSLIRRRVSEVELERVQNVTHEINGLMATMFNFGSVIIESAGANPLILDGVGNPAELQEEITQLVKAAGR